MSVPTPKQPLTFKAMIILRLSFILTLSGCALQAHQYEDGFRDRIRACASVFDDCRGKAKW